MRWTKFFIPTSKEVPSGTEAISHQLLLRAGLVQMLTAGVYSYLPLGLKALKRVEEIIRSEMNAAGAVELFLPVLQPIELWQQTGRDKTLAEVMIRFKDKKNRDMCLGPTHEEVITNLAKSFVQSYRQLPINLYQIQTKFRDEVRPRYGVVRACEFIMKDAYSFDRDWDSLKKSYALMYTAYVNIFKRCGLPVVIMEADSGAMGGDVSHEFLVPAPIGEDALLLCSACGQAAGHKDQADEGALCSKCQQGKWEKKTAIELGHIFQLGLKYSSAMQANFLDENGEQKPMVMGCYGIGVSRLIAAIIEINYDAKGIIWPTEVSPFDVEILVLKMDDPQVKELAARLEQELSEHQLDVLVDDREETAGVKFNDADLIGIPWRIILGKKTVSDQTVEIKNRRTGDVRVVPIAQAVAEIRSLVGKK